MGKTYDLLVRARGETRDAERAMRQLQNRVRGFGQSMTRAGRSLSLGVTAPILAMGALGVRELSDMQKATAQTNAVIKSTGGVAGITAKHVTDLATSLSKVSGIDDQLIQGGENILLTFNKIGKKDGTFDRATRAALDLSVAFGKDMNSSAVMVGKALQDPMKGITALSRVGVSFTQQQKDTVKKLVETGQAAKAQKLILRELETQVKGSAAAYGQTAAGAVGRLKEQFAGIAAQMVSMLLPAFESLSAKLQRGMSWFEGLSANAKRWVGIGALLAAALGPVLMVLGPIVSASAALIPLLVGISAPALAVAAAVAAVGVALVVAYRRSETFRNAVNTGFRQVLRVGKQVFGELRATIQQWVSWGRTIWAKWGADIKAIVGPALNIVLAIVRTQLGTVLDTVRGVLALLRGDWQGAWDALKRIVRRAIDGATGVLKGAGKLWLAAAKAQGKMLLSAGSSFLEWGLQLGKKIVKGIVRAIKDASGEIASAAKGAAKDALDSVIPDLPGLGRSRNGRSGRKRTSGVNQVGQLFGSNITSAQVLDFSRLSSGQAYSTTRNEDGTESLVTNSDVVAFITRRKELNEAALKTKLAARKKALAQRVAARKLYAAKRAQKAKAKNPKLRADLAKAMQTQLDRIAQLTSLIETLDMEILALGGEIQADTEALVPPEVDTTPDADTAASGGAADAGASGTASVAAPGSTGSSMGAGDYGNGWTPIGLTSQSALSALNSSVQRAFGPQVVVNASSADAEAIARRVSFILGGTRLRSGGGI